LTALLDWTVAVALSCAAAESVVAGGSLITAFFQTCGSRDME